MKPNQYHVKHLREIVHASMNEMERFPNDDRKWPAFHAFRRDCRKGYSWIFNNMDRESDEDKQLLIDCACVVVRFSDFCPTCNQRLPPALTG